MLIVDFPWLPGSRSAVLAVTLLFNKLYPPYILPCVWKYFSNPHSDHNRKQRNSQRVESGIKGKRNISYYRIKENFYHCHTINGSGLCNVNVRLSAFLTDLDLFLVVSSSKHIG